MQEISHHYLEHQHQRLLPGSPCQVGKTSQNTKNSQVLEFSPESQEFLPLSELEATNPHTYSKFERSLFLLILLIIAALGLVVSIPLWFLAQVTHGLYNLRSKE